MNYGLIRGRYLAAVAVAVVLLAAQACQAITYATITTIRSSKLSNGVQIIVTADGVLDWEYTDGRMGGSASNRVAISFPGARSEVKNYMDVSAYPVSYVQTAVPQNAKDGVGINMVVGLFTKSIYSVASGADRQSVIITVNSDRTLDRGVRNGASEAGSEQKSEMSCTCENGLLSIHCLKAAMLPALAEIGKVANINLVVDDAVEDRVVSMSLENQPPEDVLKAICSAYGLAMAKNGDVCMISEGVPTDLATYRLSGTASFPMKYVQAQTASGLLPTFLYSYLHVNGEQNAVVVSAPTQMLEKIKTDLGKVDIAPPQIMIDALAIEASSSEDLSASLGLRSQGPSGTAAVNTTTGEVEFSTVAQLPGDFEARLRTLLQTKNAKIHSTPRLAVLNGHNANLFVGAQRFIRVEYSSYGQTVERIQGVDVGTKLSISAWTGGNGEITVKLSPEVSNIVELDRSSGLPTLSSRRASTSVRVKDGETIVIGGLSTRQDYDTKRKIPLLGDIPLFGQLFRSRNRTSIDTQLLILVTPRILDNAGHLPAAEENEVKQRMLQP